MKHTQGNWAVKNGQEVVCFPDGSMTGGYYQIAFVQQDELPKERSDEEIKANARLIAAAPDLLSAAKYAVACLERLGVEMGQIGDNGDQALQILEESIKDAEG